MVLISFVSLPLDVVVVIESPTLKVLVKNVQVPVTAVPVTETVQGLYTVALTSSEPVGTQVPIPCQPSPVITLVAVPAPFSISNTTSVSAALPRLCVTAPSAVVVVISGFTL